MAPRVELVNTSHEPPYSKSDKPPATSQVPAYVGSKLLSKVSIVGYESFSDPHDKAIASFFCDPIHPRP